MLMRLYAFLVSARANIEHGGILLNRKPHSTNFEEFFDEIGIVLRSYTLEVAGHSSDAAAAAGGGHAPPRLSAAEGMTIEQMRSQAEASYLVGREVLVRLAVQNFWGRLYLSRVAVVGMETRFVDMIKAYNAFDDYCTQHVHEGSFSGEMCTLWTALMSLVCKNWSAEDKTGKNRSGLWFTTPAEDIECGKGDMYIDIAHAAALWRGGNTTAAFIHLSERSNWVEFDIGGELRKFYERCIRILTDGGRTTYNYTALTERLSTEEMLLYTVLDIMFSMQKLVISFAATYRRFQIALSALQFLRPEFSVAFFEYQKMAIASSERSRCRGDGSHPRNIFSEGSDGFCSFARRVIEDHEVEGKARAIVGESGSFVDVPWDKFYREVETEHLCGYPHWLSELLANMPYEIASRDYIEVYNTDGRVKSGALKVYTESKGEGKGRKDVGKFAKSMTFAEMLDSVELSPSVRFVKTTPTRK